MHDKFYMEQINNAMDMIHKARFVAVNVEKSMTDEQFWAAVEKKNSEYLEKYKDMTVKTFARNLMEGLFELLGGNDENIG